jgi:hypothetical protein
VDKPAATLLLYANASKAQLKSDLQYPVGVATVHPYVGSQT